MLRSSLCQCSGLSLLVGQFTGEISWGIKAMNVQNPASAHYDTVHRFARHHNAISNFLGSARANDFDLADFGSVEAERSNLTSTAGPESLPRRMASMRSAEEMANLQKLSNEYRPDVEVSSRQFFIVELILMSILGRSRGETRIEQCHHRGVCACRSRVCSENYRESRLCKFELTCMLKRLSQALPQKYSHYRTVKGDGNCGWRGMYLSPRQNSVRKRSG